MGLRTLSLSEAAGGSGADHLTCCLVTEELAAADADFAAVLAETAWLAHVLFDRAMTAAQREKFLPTFLDDHRCHLAFAGYESSVDTRIGANYHRPAKADAVPTTTAVKAASGDWVINGFEGLCRQRPDRRPLCGAGAGSRTARAGRRARAIGHAGSGGAGARQAVAARRLRHCHLQGLQGAGREPAQGGCGRAAHRRAAAGGAAFPSRRRSTFSIARAAYDAALDYARLRVQGGRPIYIEHQAIATKLADVAIRLEVAAAPLCGTPPGRPIIPRLSPTGAFPTCRCRRSRRCSCRRRFTMPSRMRPSSLAPWSVMRDMPLQKYVHDARSSTVCVAQESNGDAKLRIAEGLAGYRRATTASGGVDNGVIARRPQADEAISATKT